MMLKTIHNIINSKVKVWKTIVFFGALALLYVSCVGLFNFCVIKESENYDADQTIVEPFRRIIQKGLNSMNGGESCKTNQLQALTVVDNVQDVSDIHLQKSANTTQCPRSHLREVDASYPKTWLLSNPGSGNTWVRHLLQQLTGCPTGSIYRDGDLKQNGFPYEGATKGVVAIKAHTLYTLQKGRRRDVQLEEGDRAIILIRNPYPTFMAEYKRSILHLKHTGDGYIDNRSLSWNQFVETFTEKWSLAIRSFLKLKCDKLVVFYEDLESDLQRELVRMANFIKTPTLNEFAFCCTFNQREGYYRRPPSKQSGKTVFTKSNRQVIDSMLLDFALLLKDTQPMVASHLLNYILN